MNKSRFHQILMLVSSLYTSQTWVRLLKTGCFDATRGEKALVAWADCKTSVGMGGTRCFGPSESVFSCDKCVVTVSRLAAPGFGGFGGLLALPHTCTPVSSGMVSPPQARGLCWS